MRAIRKVTIHQDNRAARSIVDHMAIIEALERRDADEAARLAREHTLGLAAHVERHGDFLDLDPSASSSPGSTRGTSGRPEMARSSPAMTK
jgi:hypothetical protein